ncbi:MAG: hypothetical protein JXQ29_12465 [Planctomycetes bacterium]|nr:hypothetical protein [Planctomycetota bacterium]
MSRFRFVLELFRESARIGHAPLPPEAFEAALECLEFEAVRKGRLPPELGRRAHWSAAPVWDSALGEPFVAAVELELLGATAGPGPSADRAPLGGCRLCTHTFQLFAQDAVHALVRAGRLGAEERVVYRLVAYAVAPGEEAARPRAAAAPTFRTVPQPLPLEPSRLDALLADAEVCGPPHDDEMPLLLWPHVLEEAAVRTAAAGGVETGGILVGRLHRDPRGPEILAEVTAQIPARHARAGSKHLEFTPETWTDVAQALALRGAGELMLGWWHSHPARTWCGDCEPARRLACPLARGFFSAADRRLHQTVFPRAYSVALVLGDRVRNDLTWERYHDVYGWSRGDLQPRGYHLKHAPKGGNHAP